MKKRVGVLFLLGVSAAAVSTAKERWQDPEVFAINRLPAHVFSLVFPDEKSAAPEPDLANPYQGSSRFQSLNGEWRFKWSSNLPTAPDGFESPEFDVSGWHTIPVPLPWQLKGYGQIYYFNSFPPYLGEPRNTDRPDTDNRWDPRIRKMAGEGGVPSIFNPVGCYRRTFTVSNDWKGMNVVLHFGGVQSAFTCWVNGKEVGYSEDSYTPAEFDITKYLVPGTNTLAVQVIRWSDGSYMENQDMIRLSGIMRDVMLIARPTLSIKDFYLVPTLDPSIEKGVVNTRISLFNSSAKESGGSEVELTLLDESGREVLHTSASAASLPAGQTKQISLSDITLDHPKLWHPEAPHLYTALLMLKENGTVKEVIRQDVAFRRFDWDELGNFHLNGKRFYMRGVNRHDSSPETGRTVSYAEMLEDVRLMKQLNINTVRNSHYPRDPRWYALCARYGIALVDEANVETHTVEVLMADDHPEWRQQALFRVRNMVMRNRNEPAILMWSLGNEQFRDWPQSVQDQAKLAKELDPTRGIMAERAWDYKQDIIHGKGLIDFVSPMYNEVARSQSYLRHWEAGERRPFFFCEYAHCMGNSMADLDEYWAMQESHDGLNGGCIWDWADQALLMPIKGYSGRYWTVGGDWGAYSSDKIFCANGILLPDRSVATAKPFEVRAVYQQASFEPGSRLDTVRITNKYATRNLNEFDLKWMLLRNGDPVKSGMLTPDIAPLAAKEITVPFKQPDAESSDRFDLNFELLLRRAELWADAGYEVARGQIPLKIGEGAEGDFVQPSGSLKTERSDAGITVSGKDFEIVFDCRAATLSRYRLQGEDLLAPDAALCGIELNPYSSPTDDRKQWPTPAQRQAYKKGMDRLVRSQAILRAALVKEDRVVIETDADYLAPGGEGLHHKAYFTVFADGTVESDNRVQKIDLPTDSFLVRLGVRIPLVKGLDRAEYAGLGPWANYSDRKACARYGHYQLAADEFYENYIRPQDCGNREEVEWIALKSRSKGLAVTSNDRFSASVMPWTAEPMAKAEHVVELPESTRNILRIDARMSGIAKKDNVNFSGDAAFSYSIRPLRSGDQAAAVSRPRMPKEMMQPIKLTGTTISHQKPLPEGWVKVSDKATVTYSSASRFAIHKDTLLTTQDSAFSFHTEEEKEPWLIIDLKKVQPVVGLKILNRSDAQGNRTRNLRVWLSENGEDWKQVFAGTDPQVQWDVELPAAGSARYVKVGLISPEPVFFHLKGVDVFAKGE